jgi:hypothetical protein
MIIVLKLYNSAITRSGWTACGRRNDRQNISVAFTPMATLKQGATDSFQESNDHIIIGVLD